MGATAIAAAWVLSAPLGTVIGAVVAQAGGGQVPEGTGSIVGGVVASTGVGALAYWRMTRQDRELDAERAAGREMTRTVIAEVVPALERTAIIANEMRSGLTASVEAQRRANEDLLREVRELFGRRGGRT